MRLVSTMSMPWPRIGMASTGYLSQPGMVLSEGWGMPGQMSEPTANSALISLFILKPALIAPVSGYGFSYDDSVFIAAARLVVGCVAAGDFVTLCNNSAPWIICVIAFPSMFSGAGMLMNEHAVAKVS